MCVESRGLARRWGGVGACVGSRSTCPSFGGARNCRLMMHRRRGRKRKWLGHSPARTSYLLTSFASLCEVFARILSRRCTVTGGYCSDRPSSDFMRSRRPTHPSRYLFQNMSLAHKLRCSDVTSQSCDVINVQKLGFKVQTWNYIRDGARTVL